MTLLTDYAQQIATSIPDQRLRRVFIKALWGLVTHHSPLIARMVLISSTPSNEPEAPAEHVRRFFKNIRVTAHRLWSITTLGPRLMPSDQLVCPQ